MWSWKKAWPSSSRSTDPTLKCDGDICGGEQQYPPAEPGFLEYTVTQVADDFLDEIDSRSPALPRPVTGGTKKVLGMLPLEPLIKPTGFEKRDENF